MLDEAHKRGMKVHAWFNPYRVSVNTKSGTIRELNSTLSQQPASVYVQHRDWIRTSGDRFVLDPGIPEVQDWITSIVAEVVSRYPVDGVQFDDYFYTESPASRLMITKRTANTAAHLRQKQTGGATILSS